MLRHVPARCTQLGAVLLAATALYGCSDTPLPVAPRVPDRPQLTALVATVTNIDDSGPGSLRDAIAAAAPGTTIQFDPGIAGQTILLTTAPLDIDKPLTIEGPSDKGLTISGGLALRVLGVVNPGSTVLRNLSIVNGRAEFGAGILLIAESLTLDHVLLANNEASANGGGIAIKAGSLTVVNSTISGNIASQGAGILGGEQLVIRNSTIAANTARRSGGGILGGSSITLRNSIIASNVDLDPTTDDANCGFAQDEAVALVGRNVSSDATCGTGVAMIIGDAKLGPLANNGGPTATHALLDGSPAIDAGALCTESTDQRYVARPQGPSCDAGAFEFTDYGAYTIAIGPNVAVNPKTGVASVAGTISCSKPTSAMLRVRLSQTQKTLGKFTTIVQGNALASVASCTSTPVSWSAAVTPDAGKFENGTASGRATTEPTPPGFLTGDVTVPVKLFSVK